MIDTETSLDVSQRLSFGVYRHLARRDLTPLQADGWDCVAEGLIYADELPETDPHGFALLQNYTRTRSAKVRFDAHGVREPNWQLGLYSRTEFAEQWWRRLGVPTSVKSEPAVLVFFNAPFDISRLAAGVANARRDMAGGFSFQVMANADGTRRKFRPDVAVKQIDSKRALKKNRAVEKGQSKIPGYAGHYLDLRTAVFALTGRSHTLASACGLYDLPGKSDAELGVISTLAIDYCCNDVAITSGLFEAVVNDFEAHSIPLQLTQAYSPASLAKAYLQDMGVKPLLGEGGAGAATPGWLLGAAMSAFFGGRAECRIRCTPVPVVLVDFTSMYPTVNALMGSWNLITAEDILVIDTEENTQQVQSFLDTVDAEAMFDPKAWPELLTLVEIEPHEDVLPVRAEYRAEEWSIGVNYFTDEHRAHWYALADLVASKILSGKAPRVLRAVTFRPRGQADGLRATKLRSEVPIDPRTEDFFVTVIEQRQLRKQEFGDDDPVQAFLKVLANSGSYGIYAQFTAQDHPATVFVYSGNTERTAPTSTVKRPEKAGPYCYPPLAACITAAARLMLALLENDVTAVGGHWAFCDTDSMAIVATEHGGELIPCDGGSVQMSAGRSAIRALSRKQVELIQEKFDRLNPYDTGIVRRLLKEEAKGMCLAISAKRYALYNQGHDGSIEIIKASEHGLGQLLDPVGPESPVTKDKTGCRPWIQEVWQAIIRAANKNEPIELPLWAAKPAHSRLSISSPRLLKPFEAWNEGKTYADQIKPANFMITATIYPFGLPPALRGEPVRLVAPYRRNAASQTEWTNLYAPESGTITTTTQWTLEVSDAVVIKTYAQIIGEYSVHPEAKFIDHTGKPCRRVSRGLLQRDHIRSDRRIVIGKGGQPDRRSRGRSSHPGRGHHHLRRRS